ncbi:multicopper oxidase domain-containing protein [Microbispora sp. RL4-1S]|uniref:Multicopper oxidase domain-containing protein n=1 Tax=Microbispora oryzae TaxID=2806554 RepID=A0A940WNP6_9ACTN|nr:multicopper oxidase domain-containing protein [Microbispora oryzae]MBP2706747.1 multicopper oxidase domain-containing protein [Microbispora oryzae]
MTEKSTDVTRRLFSRRAFTATAATAAVIAPFAVVSQATAEPAGKTAGKTAGEPGEVRRITLYVENMPDGQMGYGLEPGKPTIPGPLIEMIEGETLEIELVNNADVTASLHAHGVDYEATSDGTRMNDSVVEPGGRYVYTWRTHAPATRSDGTIAAGSAGYWHYHDHVVGTDHGTGGILRGLYGPLVVRRTGDVLPDKTFTVVFNDMKTNNLTPAPDFTAKLGERVEFVVVAHGNLFHTFHIHGHRWADNRTGMLKDPEEQSRIIDTKTTGPAESFGFQVIAGERVGPGMWMYHCHVQGHSDAGMAGTLMVTDADGNVPGHSMDDMPEPSMSVMPSHSMDDMAGHSMDGM